MSKDLGFFLIHRSETDLLGIDFLALQMRDMAKESA